MQLVPAAVDGTPSRIAKLKASSAFVVVSWAAARVGSLPDVPPLVPPDPSSQVLLSWVCEPEMCVLGADGVTPIFAVAGTYQFACKTTPDPANIKGGVPPWTNIPGAVNVYSLLVNTSKTGVY